VLGFGCDIVSNVRDGDGDGRDGRWQHSDANSKGLLVRVRRLSHTGASNIEAHIAPVLVNFQGAHGARSTTIYTITIFPLLPSYSITI